VPNPEKERYFLDPLADRASAYIHHLKSAAQSDRDAFWKAKAQGEKERVRKLSSERSIHPADRMFFRVVFTHVFAS
jgi:hypothetical protein